MSYDTDLIFRCTCGASHFLTISSIDDEGYLHLEGSFLAPTFLRKLKACYDILRNGHGGTWIEVSLDKETASEIRDELGYFIREPN